MNGESLDLPPVPIDKIPSSELIFDLPPSSAEFMEGLPPVPLDKIPSWHLSAELPGDLMGELPPAPFDKIPSGHLSLEFFGDLPPMPLDKIPSGHLSLELPGDLIGELPPAPFDKIPSRHMSQELELPAVPFDKIPSGHLSAEIPSALIENLPPIPLNKIPSDDGKNEVVRERPRSRPRERKSKKMQMLPINAPNIQIQIPSSNSADDLDNYNLPFISPRGPINQAQKPEKKKSGSKILLKKANLIFTPANLNLPSIPKAVNPSIQSARRQVKSNFIPSQNNGSTTARDRVESTYASSSPFAEFAKFSDGTFPFFFSF